MSRDSPATSPSRGISHSAWLRRTFSGDSGHGLGAENVWPDLLVDRRSLAERKQAPTQGWDTFAIERNNIVGLSQLVIKSVVDQSLKSGRQLDADNIPLHQLFIILELALKHGLSNKRSLLIGRQKDVWDLIQHVEKLDSRAIDITDTVRQLSTVNTPPGRVRAWLRLATMQKKLADYFKLLVDDKSLIVEFYEPEALMRSDEAVLLCGLLVSLNIVDCNLCLKEEDLDSQEAVIDMTYYLRRKEDIGRDDEFDAPDDKDISIVMDQKSYIEEVNRNLAANVANLQSRIDSLNSMNALLREDVAISKKKATVLEEENAKLTAQMDKYPNPSRNSPDLNFQNLDPKKEDEFEAKLKQLKVSNQELEKELILEVQMKAEMEVAMKLLEKDVHEKQDTIISLRNQLEDIKEINLEMYTKLSECEKAISYKSDLIQKLEKKTVAMGNAMDELEKKNAKTEKNLIEAKTDYDALKTKVNESDSKQFELESDLKIEREWRERLQESIVHDRETISNLRQDNEFLKHVSSDYDNLRQDNERLREQVKDGEKTMEELGQQLSSSKLQVNAMKDEASSVGSTWQSNAEAAKCKICDKDFTMARRRHHCRNCGGIFCDKCSDNKMSLASSAKPLRVCDNCYMLLLDRQSKLP